MVKNKLEKIFSKSIKADSRLWGMKLHNNPLAHNNTPADYILSYELPTVVPPKLGMVVLVEAKQVTCKNGKGRLAHKRLKQLHDCLSFDNKFYFHKAYFVIGFYDGRWPNSDVYIVPVKFLYEAIQAHTMVSFNREDFGRIFSAYKTTIDKGVIDIWTTIQ